MFWIYLCRRIIIKLWLGRAVLAWTFLQPHLQSHLQPHRVKFFVPCFRNVSRLTGWITGRDTRPVQSVAGQRTTGRLGSDSLSRLSELSIPRIRPESLSIIRRRSRKAEEKKVSRSKDRSRALDHWLVVSYLASRMDKVVCILRARSIPTIQQTE